MGDPHRKNPAAGLQSRRGLSKYYNLGKERADTSKEATVFNCKKRVRHIQHSAFRNRESVIVKSIREVPTDPSHDPLLMPN